MVQTMAVFIQLTNKDLQYARYHGKCNWENAQGKANTTLFHETYIIGKAKDTSQGISLIILRTASIHKPTKEI